MLLLLVLPLVDQSGVLARFSSSVSEKFEGDDGGTTPGGECSSRMTLSADSAGGGEDGDGTGTAEMFVKRVSAPAPALAVVRCG